MAASSPSSAKRAPKTGQMDRTRGLILDATVSLLGELGYRSLTIEQISQASGVARSTIYRHFESIPDIAMGAFLVILGEPVPAPQTGNVRTDLAVIYHRLVKALERSRWGQVLPAMVEAAIADPAFAKLLYEAISSRRTVTDQLLRNAQQQGTLSSAVDPNSILDPLTGAIYFRLLFTDRPLAAVGEIEYWVNAAIDAAQPKA